PARFWPGAHRRRISPGRLALAPAPLPLLAHRLSLESEPLDGSVGQSICSTEPGGGGRDPSGHRARRSEPADQRQQWAGPQPLFALSRGLDRSGQRRGSNHPASSCASGHRTGARRSRTASLFHRSHDGLNRGLCPSRLRRPRRRCPQRTSYEAANEPWIACAKSRPDCDKTPRTQTPKMSAAQFGKISTAPIDKMTTQHLAIASRFTTKPNGKSSRKKRGTLQEAGQPFFLSTLEESCAIMTLKVGAWHGFVP